MKIVIAILASVLVACSPVAPVEHVQDQSFYTTQDYKSCEAQPKQLWCQIACSDAPDLKWCK